MPKKQVVDPDKTQLTQTTTWNSINNHPNDKIEQVIRPKIVVKDLEACQHIIKCIEKEKNAESLQKQWQMAMRLKDRQRLVN